MPVEKARPTRLSGRVSSGPSHLLRAEVLDPQFDAEVNTLLPHYVAIEKALVAEYVRMGLLAEGSAHEINALLDSVDRDSMIERSATAMSDMAFTLEQHVEAGLGEPVAAWHVDRSRNDYQACAQLLFGRSRLLDAAATLLEFGRAAHRLAGRHTEHPMPGYTHLQAAQIISPGFYLAALSEQAQHSARRLLSTYDSIDACPLGAGAMSGQTLPWDRRRLARLLGFQRIQPLALTSVAHRGWTVEITAEFEILGVQLSRFVTDLMTWGSSAYGFLDLPDELSGISSAMPQKKNFPILERIRGRLAHLSSTHLDTVLGQRNTAFSNSVEVSKEAGTEMPKAFDTFESALRLFTVVLDNARFDVDRMARACEKEFLGGFALANRLTLHEGVPWRLAQVIAGRYIVMAMDADLKPVQINPDLLIQAAAENGCQLQDPRALLHDVFDVAGALWSMNSSGSTHPEAVGEVLADQEREFERLAREWNRRRSQSQEGGNGVVQFGHERG
ncbi:lyase family protein [Streptomyces sp. MBT27]|uniref:argininosuccinate lyase n=1 Tax=Streptomyces sp. MBT27 TaxID=1488356 RepID=UPI001424711D|nr:lyase family protein [Streptomyces sp. MBT27]